MTRGRGRLIEQPHVVEAQIVQRVDRTTRVRVAEQFGRSARHNHLPFAVLPPFSSLVATGDGALHVAHHKPTGALARDLAPSAMHVLREAPRVLTPIRVVRPRKGRLKLHHVEPVLQRVVDPLCVRWIDDELEDRLGYAIVTPHGQPIRTAPTGIRRPNTGRQTEECSQQRDLPARLSSVSAAPWRNDRLHLIAPLATVRATGPLLQAES